MKHYAGLDVSLETTAVCVLDVDGEVVCETSVESHARKDGFGIRLIDELIQQVDGRIEYLSTSQGLTVRVTLPAVLETAGSRTGTLKQNRQNHSSVAQLPTYKR